MKPKASRAMRAHMEDALEAVVYVCILGALLVGAVAGVALGRASNTGMCP